MNFYEHHLGDYSKDAGHLSMLEHGAYRLLLDRYYSTEKGIPESLAHRYARARSEDEKAAVDAVLVEFFELIDGVWINHRAEEEIARYQEKIPESEQKKLNAKERQRRARERRKELFEQLSDAGIHMAWNATTDELVTALHGIQSQTSHAPVTRDNTATQSPVPSPHTPDDIGESVENSNSVGDGKIASPTLAGEICASLKRLGMSMVNPSNPTLLMLIEAGASLDEFADLAAEIKQTNPDKFNFNYVIGAIKGRRRDAANQSAKVFKGPLTHVSVTQIPGRPQTVHQARMTTAEQIMAPFKEQSDAREIDITDYEAEGDRHALPAAR